MSRSIDQISQGRSHSFTKSNRFGRVNESSNTSDLNKSQNTKAWGEASEIIDQT